MIIRSVATATWNWSGDCLALGLFQDDVESAKQASEKEGECQGAWRALITESEFTGRLGSVASARIVASGRLRTVAAVGLGRRENVRLDDLRRAGAAIARIAKQEKPRTLGVCIPEWRGEPGSGIQATVEGLELAMHEGLWLILSHRFNSTSDQEAPYCGPELVDLLNRNDVDSAIVRGRRLAEGFILSRELVAAPANVITPAELAETAGTIAREYDLKIDVLEIEDCRRLGMGAFLAVAGGSSSPAKFIHLHYESARPPRRRLAMIGQGLTFERDGLIKGVRPSVEEMKKHMAGAGSVLGAAKVIAQLKPDVDVHFIISASENSAGERSLRPGDLVTAMNGETIEVNSVDAEGRLLLADAILFANKLSVDAIVDVATISSACVVALGEELAGIWASDEGIAREVLRAGELAGERLWRMPLVDEYSDSLRAPFANMRSSGPAEGAAITAALFLRHFVGRTPWAHIDITGPAWSSRVNGYYNAGATGWGVGTLVNWAES